MTPAEWQQVNELFHAALEREPAHRSLFLDEACSGDTALRSEIEALIQSHEKQGQFIDAPAYELAADLIVKQPTGIASGQALGAYRILSTLGRGGMGEVYLAEDVRLGRKVALKFLPASYNTDTDRLRRFEREARAASALNHPHILTIYEVGSFDGRQFIATEFVEGETLRQRQLHSPLKVNEILELALQVTSALSAAHQAGIVHRDIKPENIMLRNDGYAKVVDFGLAKLTETANVSADTSILQVDTGTGVVMGTTAYMSPEQARGLPLDARTDIWSLGVVLYELLSGVSPFKGDTPSDLIVSILERDPSPLITTPLLPSELDWIVRRALRKDREERYQTARELLGDLRVVKQQLEFAAQTQRADSEPHSSVTGAHDARGPATGEIGAAVSTTKHPALPASRRNSATVVALGLISLLLIAGAFIGYKFFSRTKRLSPFQSVTLTRITNSGKAIDATLSPDGKYIVYALSDAGKQSLWIRQVSTANDKLILAPAPIGLFGITFSPDGNDLYYAVKANLDRGTLYRVPTLGGTSTKILEGIDGPVSFSPEGKQMVLVRGNYPSRGDSALVIASADGSNERTLAVRKPPAFFSPIFFTGPSWSADGKLIAASVAQIGAPSHVIVFSVDDARETDLTPEPWNFTSRVQWLPDTSGLLVIAGDNGGTSQVWMVSYPEGTKRRITNDLNTYRALGLSSDGRKFTTVQASGLVNIWVVPEGDAKRAIQLPTGNVGFLGGAGKSLSWTPDGRIVFVSNESGTLDLWIMNADGSNRRQLTAHAGVNGSPIVSQDGRFIVFNSSRAGTQNIWRMNIDGSNFKRLTSGAADFHPALTPDNKWVFYSSSNGARATLWRVPADGGTPVELVNGVAMEPVVSPDGTLLLYLYPDSPDDNAPPNRFAIISIDGGEPLKTFSFQPTRTTAASVQWSHDGRSIVYTVNNNNVTNLWSQPLAGGPPKQVTDFKDSLMTGFAWSPDGKTLAATRGVLLRDAVLISE
jgi:serine/threonine protein kinase